LLHQLHGQRPRCGNRQVSQLAAAGGLDARTQRLPPFQQPECQRGATEQ
jgi:hypothetical protein